MRKPILSLAVFVAVSLIGCQRQPPAASQPRDINPAAIKPYLVKSNAGIAHEFYRGVSLDEFLKTLPPGSVDFIDLVLDKSPQVFALIKVPDQSGKDFTHLRFETTFKTRDGQVIDKRWTAAQDRKSGEAKAVFCVPLSVVEGETKVVPIDE